MDESRKNGNIMNTTYCRFSRDWKWFYTTCHHSESGRGSSSSQFPLFFLRSIGLLSLAWELNFTLSVAYFSALFYISFNLIYNNVVLFKSLTCC